LHAHRRYLLNLHIRTLMSDTSLCSAVDKAPPSGARPVERGWGGDKEINFFRAPRRLGAPPSLKNIQTGVPVWLLSDLLTGHSKSRTQGSCRLCTRSFMASHRARCWDRYCTCSTRRSYISWSSVTASTCTSMLTTASSISVLQSVMRQQRSTSYLPV